MTSASCRYCSSTAGPMLFFHSMFPATQRNFVILFSCLLCTGSMFWGSARPILGAQYLCTAQHFFQICLPASRLIGTHYAKETEDSSTRWGCSSRRCTTTTTYSTIGGGSSSSYPSSSSCSHTSAATSATSTCCTAASTTCICTAAAAAVW